LFLFPSVFFKQYSKKRPPDEPPKLKHPPPPPPKKRGSPRGVVGKKPKKKTHQIFGWATRQTHLTPPHQENTVTPGGWGVGRFGLEGKRGGVCGGCRFFAPPPQTARGSKRKKVPHKNHNHGFFVLLGFFVFFSPPPPRTGKKKKAKKKKTHPSVGGGNTKDVGVLGEKQQKGWGGGLGFFGGVAPSRTKGQGIPQKGGKTPKLTKPPEREKKNPK